MSGWNPPSYLDHGLRKFLEQLRLDVDELKRRGIPISNPPEVNPSQVVAAGSAASMLALSASTSIASGGAYVSFGATVYNHGFSGFGGDTIVWPRSGVGSIQVELAWGSYTGGGKIEIEVDGVVPDWGLLADESEGQRGVKRRSVHIGGGSLVRIKVTQDSGSAQTASVWAEFSTEDPSNMAGSMDLLETMWVDTVSESAVTSATVLATGVVYRIVATGNAAYEPAVMDEGAPDAVMFPSSTDATNAQVDAECVYAWYSGNPTTKPPIPSHQGYLRVNVGSGFFHPEPVGGAASAPSPDHSYTYLVTGQGSGLSAYMWDSFYFGNNGRIRLDIYGAG